MSAAVADRPKQLRAAHEYEANMTEALTVLEHLGPDADSWMVAMMDVQFLLGCVFLLEGELRSYNAKALDKEIARLNAEQLAVLTDLARSLP